jgi:CopG family transcriptional regulator / antitoxin EndoAI
MHHRINLTIPSETLELLDKFAPKGERSRFIHEAIQHYIAQIEKQKLTEQLIEGAINRADRDRHLAEDWFVIEEEAWEQNEK